KSNPFPNSKSNGVGLVVRAWLRERLDCTRPPSSQSPHTARRRRVLLGFRRDVAPAERAGADAEGQLQADGGRGGEPPPPRGPDDGHAQGQARGKSPEEALRWVSRLRRRCAADGPLHRAPAEAGWLAGDGAGRPLQRPLRAA
ncbi:Importin subunit alpha-2, partial [Zea mays]